MTGVPHIEGRWWGSTSASVAAHAALLALLMLVATRVSNIADPPRALSAGPTVFLREAGPGGGGGGGGDTSTERARAALMKRTPRPSIPTPSDAIQPTPPVPAIAATAVETVPGAPTSIDPSASRGMLTSGQEHRTQRRLPNLSGPRSTPGTPNIHPSTCATVRSDGVRLGFRRSTRSPRRSARDNQAAMLKASC